MSSRRTASGGMPRVRIPALGCFGVARLSEAGTGEVSDAPAAAAAYWSEHIAGSPFIQDGKEHVVVLAMNCQLRVLGWSLISMGTVSECAVDISGVFRPLIVSGAAGFILMHNHPSGNPEPSGGDITFTGTLGRAAKMMGLKFHDHIIIGSGPGEHYSMRGRSCPPWENENGQQAPFPRRSRAQRVLRVPLEIEMYRDDYLRAAEYARRRKRDVAAVIAARLSRMDLRDDNEPLFPPKG